MCHDVILPDMLKDDPHFKPLIKKYGPVVREYRGDPFQSLVRSIIYQQVSGKAAASILAKFCGLFPAEAFPTPSEVLLLSIDTMRSAGLSIQKTTYIRDLAEKFQDGTVTPRTFDNMSSEEIITHLLVVKGIGEWTVHMFLMSTLGRPDILPTGDLGIKKGFQVVYNLQDLPTKIQMEKLATSWRSEASDASWYLWRVADDAKEVQKLPNIRKKYLT